MPEGPPSMLEWFKKNSISILLGFGAALVGLHVTNTLPFEVQGAYLENTWNALGDAAWDLTHITENSSVSQGLADGMTWRDAVLFGGAMARLEANDENIDTLMKDHEGSSIFDKLEINLEALFNQDNSR